MEDSFYVYILEVEDGSLYTGHTNNIQRRMNEHRNGRGSKYVRARRPFKLRYTESHNSRSDAMKREYQIKKFSRSRKLDLISKE